MFKLIKLTFILSVLFSKLHGNTPDNTLLGSYWVGIGVSHTSGDNFDSNGLSSGLNLPVHQNISLGVGVGGGSGDFDNLPTEYDTASVSFGIAFHKLFKNDKVSFDPVIALSSGFGVVDYSNLVTYSPFFGYSTTSARYNIIPISLSIGSDIYFSDFFSIGPGIAANGYIDDDGLNIDSYFSYGIDATFYFADRFSWSINLGGTSNSSYNIGTRVRGHF